jgi:hypothetical protein
VVVLAAGVCRASSAALGLGDELRAFEERPPRVGLTLSLEQFGSLHHVVHASEAATYSLSASSNARPADRHGKESRLT